MRPHDLVLVGLIAFVTRQQAWPQVWLVETGSLDLPMWAVLVGTPLAVSSDLTLRRLPV